MEAGAQGRRGWKERHVPDVAAGMNRSKCDLIMDISYRNLQMISEALGTQIRLMSSYINKTQEQEIKILHFRKLKEDIDILLLGQ